MPSLSPEIVWFLVGVGLLLSELAVPGFVVFFFGLGCWFAALVAWIFPSTSLAFQIGVFLAFSLITLFTLRKMCMRTFFGKDADKPENGFDEDVAGRTALVTKSIAPALPGEIKFKGSFWRAEADTDIPEGASVRIERRKEGEVMTFIVKQAGG